MKYLSVTLLFFNLVSKNNTFPIGKELSNYEEETAENYDSDSEELPYQCIFERLKDDILRSAQFMIGECGNPNTTDGELTSLLELSKEPTPRMAYASPNLADTIMVRGSLFYGDLWKDGIGNSSYTHPNIAKFVNESFVCKRHVDKLGKDWHLRISSMNMMKKEGGKQDGGNQDEGKQEGGGGENQEGGKQDGGNQDGGDQDGGNQDGGKQDEEKLEPACSFPNGVRGAMDHRTLTLANPHTYTRRKHSKVLIQQRKRFLQLGSPLCRHHFKFLEDLVFERKLELKQKAGGTAISFSQTSEYEGEPLISSQDYKRLLSSDRRDEAEGDESENNNVETPPLIVPIPEQNDKILQDRAEKKNILELAELQQISNFSFSTDFAALSPSTKGQRVSALHQLLERFVQLMAPDAQEEMWRLLLKESHNKANPTKYGGPTARVVGSVDQNQASGRIEVFSQGEWGTVCDDDWDDKDASVVCRQLGYNNGVALHPDSSHYASGEGNIWLDDVKCQGDENDIFECTTDPHGHHDCSHNEDAGVQCYN